MSQVFPGLLGTFGVVPGLLGTFGRGTLVVMAGRTSRDVLGIWDFWTWDFGSHVW